MFFQTGIDEATTRRKVISVLKIPFTSTYKIWGERLKGRRIKVISSKKTYFQKLPQDVKNREQVLKYIKSEFLKYLGDRKILWKAWWDGGEGFVCIIDVSEEKEGQEFEAEPIALTRTFIASGGTTGEVWDFGESKITRVWIKDKKPYKMRVYFGDVKPEPPTSSTLVVLTGGKREKYTSLFKNCDVLEPAISPEKATAFGGALAGIIGKNLPFFGKETSVELKNAYFKTATTLATASLIIIGSVFVLKEVKIPIVKSFKTRERVVFKKYFPDIPAVAPLSQVKAMLTQRKSDFYQKLTKALTELPKGVNLLGIYYDENGFKIKVQVQQGLKFSLEENATEVKTLPDGSKILEVQL